MSAILTTLIIKQQTTAHLSAFEPSFPRFSMSNYHSVTRKHNCIALKWINLTFWARIARHFETRTTCVIDRELLTCHYPDDVIATGSLTTGTGKIRWKQDENLHKQSFWDAKNEILRAMELLKAILSSWPSRWKLFRWKKDENQTGKAIFPNISENVRRFTFPFLRNRIHQPTRVGQSPKRVNTVMVDASWHWTHKDAAFLPQNIWLESLDNLI